VPIGFQQAGNKSRYSQPQFKVNQMAVFWMIRRDRGGFAIETHNYLSELDRQIEFDYYQRHFPISDGFKYEIFETRN
jgi:hypothetical protein